MATQASTRPTKSLECYLTVSGRGSVQRVLLSVDTVYLDRKTRFSGRIQEAARLISIRVIPATDALVYHIANNRELHTPQCGV